MTVSADDVRRLLDCQDGQAALVAIEGRIDVVTPAARRPRSSTLRSATWAPDNRGALRPLDGGRISVNSVADGRGEVVCPQGG